MAIMAVVIALAFFLGSKEAQEDGRLPQLKNREI